jgi:hypothetical protein
MLDACKEAGQEVNMEKTKYMFMSHHQTTEQNHYTKVANKSFENVTKFKYFIIMATNQNCIHREAKNRLNSGNACYRGIQNVLSSMWYLKCTD